MSYCRLSNGQVYLYGNVNGMFCCCGCFLLIGTYPHRRDALRFSQEDSVWLPTRSAAILHLRHHRLYGHKFPARAEKRLIQELKEEGEFMTGLDEKDTCLICLFRKSKPLSYEKYKKQRDKNFASVLKKLKRKTVPTRKSFAKLLLKSINHNKKKEKKP
jgi:hypothetical protein